MANRMIPTLVALLSTFTAGAADLEQGRAKSLGCQACHGSDGIGTAPDIPNLAGQKAGYIATQLTAFRAQTRKHDLMNAIANQLSDADIENLGAFWSSLTPNEHVADAAAEFRKSRVSFPASFPKDFVMYTEELDADKHSTKRSYANHVALAAARAGKELPPGSIIVVENGAPGAATYAAMESEKGWPGASSRPTCQNSLRSKASLPLAVSTPKAV